MSIRSNERCPTVVCRARVTTLRALQMAVLFAAVGLWPQRAYAHSLSMAVLTLHETAADVFFVQWQQSGAVRDSAVAFRLLQPVFPAGCRFEAPVLDCSGPGLFGELGFDGLGTAASSAVVNILWQTDPPQSFTFTQRDSRIEIAGSDGDGNSWARVAPTFLRLGVEHILLGWDHLLFVLGLFWIVRGRRTLVTTLTGFTLAHSLTLTSATLGWANVPVPPVEAVIALSIVFVAVEAVKLNTTGETSLATRRPWLVAFGFGLLHGFGFASALSELSIPKNNIPASLLFFNVGVELGQLVFVLALWALGMALRPTEGQSQRKVLLVGQYCAGTLALYWFLERVAGFAQSG